MTPRCYCGYFYFLFLQNMSQRKTSNLTSERLEKVKKKDNSAVLGLSRNPETFISQILWSLSTPSGNTRTRAHTHSRAHTAQRPECYTSKHKIKVNFLLTQFIYIKSNNPPGLFIYLFILVLSFNYLISIIMRWLQISRIIAHTLWKCACFVKVSSWTLTNVF